ncbi:hypothetical protein ColKHC_09048 [Colletotrichum higginsianum]|nr:hypothetical protein CDEST_10551 [Colletotrichum destructivum]GJD00223.1 hypothetical protein ColKHC_09048 [Colletotrichum higginsianum]
MVEKSAGISQARCKKRVDIDELGKTDNRKLEERVLNPRVQILGLDASHLLLMPSNAGPDLVEH